MTASARSRRGRAPSAPSAPAARTVTLGIDLGATKLVSALVAPDGRRSATSSHRLHANNGPQSVVDELVVSATESLSAARGPVPQIGIGVAAQVDPRRGTVVFSPNLRWREVPLAAEVRQRLGRPVSLINDARAATLAEWRVGAARGETDVVCLSLGTGIGGSVVAGGRLLEGGRFAAGEVGHLTIVSGGRRCHCPNRGCWEAYVGGWAIAERAVEAYAAVRRSARAGGRPPPSSAREIFRAAVSGDRTAASIVRETEGYFADGVVSVANAFNPSVIVLVGGLVSGWPRLVEVARRAVRDRCQPPAAGARVVAGRLGEFATVVGAALAVNDHRATRRARR